MRDTELKRERDRALYHTYVTALREVGFLSTKEAVDWCRTRPAPKFYISAKSLVNYFAQIKKYGNLDGLHYETREKVVELYRRYAKFRREHPEKGWMSTIRVCELLADEPAPSFYLGHELAEKIILKERRR